MRGFELGYDVRLPAMVIDEILANQSVERRDALLRRLGRFLDKSRCIAPPHEVVRSHVLAYHHAPSAYKWNQVYVRLPEYERVISLHRTLPEELFEEQRRVQLHLQKQFRQVWTGLRPKLDEIIKRNPAQRLNSFEEAAQASTKPGGVLWGFGIGLFKKALEGHVPEMTDEQIKPFIDACPPFRAVCYSFVKAWYNFSLGPTHDSTPKAGRNDLMMSAYLPYCDKFLTADYAQCKDLEDIAHAAKLQCKVQSLQDFTTGFSII